ncbi:MAG: ATP-dependent DNA helicase RecG [Bacteroidetes bacterium]|nr:ATP-dependent DNA helicase RecG [Bacteroidota bacterium]
MHPSGSKLDTPIEFLKGVGPMRASLLKLELGIATFSDLLQHYPYRYFDRRNICPIASLRPDMDYVQLAGTLTNIVEVGHGGKRRMEALLYDSTGRIDLVWFGGIQWLKKMLHDGGNYYVFGKLSEFGGSWSLTQPEMEVPGEDTLAGQMQPMYNTTQKLLQRGLSNRSIGKLTQALLQQLAPQDVPEIFPEPLLQQFDLMGRYESFGTIHFPRSEEYLQAAIRRIKFEELFASQLVVARARQQHKQQPGYVFARVGAYFNDFYQHHLPFELTGAQKRVLKEIRQDTAHGQQMNRLLQGDVGSGKTIVAVMIALLALDNGFQACIMAPTEILAQQHFNSIAPLLAPMKVPVALLTGSVKGKERKQVLAGLADGSILISVGTHALIEDQVRYQRLGLAIIDEQHRFGVGQRSRLWKKSELPPHMLVMTATPIPRTLAMSLYGDLEVSVIDELPPGRREIRTVHRNEHHRTRVMEFVRQQIDQGRQAYIVYPLIEESEKLDFESLMAGYEQVKIFFPEHKYRIAMVHGRQEAGERQRNMERFVRGEAQVLVATTVIEVGVNVPNATVMVVESAERFGLSQLHQLRGRVGRGAEQSFCILLTGNKLGDDSRLRMNIMVQTSNGFTIAEEDLRLRGPGDIYGTRQSGALRFKLADIVADATLMEQTREAAQSLVASDPGLQHYPGIRALVENTGQTPFWGKIS